MAAAPAALSNKTMADAGLAAWTTAKGGMDAGGLRDAWRGV